MNNNSYDSSRTSSGSCSCPRKEPDVTVDDVAAVVLGLNNKVVQLRKEILELKGCPSSQESSERVGYLNREDEQSKIASRESFTEREEYFIPRRRKQQDSKQPIRKDSTLKYGRREDIPTKMIAKELNKEEYIPKKKKDYSQSSRKNSKLTFAQSFHPANEKKLSNREKTPNILFERQKQRQKTLKSSSDEYQEKKLHEKSLSESPDRVYDVKPKRGNYHRISMEKRKSHSTDKILTQQPKLVKKEKERYVDSSKTRKKSKMIDKISPDHKKITNRLDPDKHYGKRLTTNTDNENDRIVLPSRMSLKCQGIRHAFGLSNAYCNCVTTGNGIPRVRKKRISRGVQCNRSDICKHKISSGLCGCFAFKCCAKKSNKTRRKKSKNSSKKTDSVASSEIYRPKKNEIKKKTTTNKEAIKNKMLIEKVRRNQRMSGGGEEIYSNRTIENHSIDTNDILYVKRRLNECLIELNGIIGDVGFIFEEN